MAGGISINILADVREAVRGVTDVAEVVEEVGDRLHDLTKESGDTTDRMEKDFRDLSREADRQSDELRDKFRKAYKDVKNSSDDTKEAAVKNTRKMGEQAAEVGGEIRQNLGEGIANAARGDFESLADTIGDTLGGVTAGIGGIGTAAIAAAGAAGLGLIIGAFNAINEANEASQERIAEWADKFIEAGGRVLTAGQVIAGSNDILTDPEKYKKAQDAAEKWGVSIETAILAQAGNLESVDEVSKSLDKQRDAFEKARDAGELSYDEQSKVLGQLADATGKYNELTGEIEHGTRRAGLYSQMLKDVAANTEGATEKTDKFGDKVVSLPDGTTIYIDAETGQATDDVQKIKDQVYGIKDKDVKVRVGIEDRASGEVDRIVRRINGRVASIKVTASRDAV